MSRRNARAAILGGIIMLPLLLSGCLRANVDVRVDAAGDLGPATLEVGLQKTVAEEMGIKNIQQFETKLEDIDKITDSDLCSFGENSNEYWIDCHTINVKDNAGAFEGVKAEAADGGLIFTAEKGALTSKLEGYGHLKDAVGSIAFYFDGDIADVDAPQSEYRIPTQDVIIFDLKNGKFFQEDVTVTVKPHSDYVAAYGAIVGASVAAIAAIGVAVLVLRRRRANINPFSAQDDVEAPREGRPVVRDFLHGSDTN